MLIKSFFIHFFVVFYLGPFKYWYLYLFSSFCSGGDRSNVSDINEPTAKAERNCALSRFRGPSGLGWAGDGMG